MILKVDAIHTVGVLKPTRDLPLRENQRVRLIVQPIEKPEQNRAAARRGSRAWTFSLTERSPRESNGIIESEVDLLFYSPADACRTRLTSVRSCGTRRSNRPQTVAWSTALYA